MSRQSRSRAAPVVSREQLARWMAVDTSHRLQTQSCSCIWASGFTRLLCLIARIGLNALFLVPLRKCETLPTKTGGWNGVQRVIRGRFLQTRGRLLSRSLSMLFTARNARLWGCFVLKPVLCRMKFRSAKIFETQKWRNEIGGVTGNSAAATTTQTLVSNVHKILLEHACSENSWNARIQLFYKHKYCGVLIFLRIKHYTTVPNGWQIFFFFLFILNILASLTKHFCSMGIKK